MTRARPSCLVFERQEVFRADSRAWAKTGKRMAARIAIMAITTSSSIRVNPEAPFVVRMRDLPFHVVRIYGVVSGQTPIWVTRSWDNQGEFYQNDVNGTLRQV